MGTDNKQSEFEAHLDAFLASFKPTPEALKKREEANAQREEFIRRFPLDSIPNLTPEQYCIGRGNKESFCWWVERGTKAGNSYFPGSSASYGMWYSKHPGKFRKWYRQDGAGYGMILQVQAYIDEHVGATDADALREVILKPLHAFIASHGQNMSHNLNDLDIGHGYILKLLSLYSPDDYFVINSEKWISKVLAAIGENTKTNPYEGNRLICQFYNRKKEQFPNIDFSQYDFEAFLERELNLKAKESADEEVVEVETQYREGTIMEAIHPLNTILYGPPGTGKTYNTVIYAVAIIEGKPVEAIQSEDYEEIRKRYDAFKKQGRIAFTTFHQSYGYEDFIEGIRPVMSGEGNENVSYEMRNGAFKSFCCSAQLGIGRHSFDIGLNDNPKVWKVSLEGTGDNPTRADCLDNGYIRIGWDEYGKDITDESFKASNSGKQILDAFINKMQVGDIVVSCYSAKETDAIGVITGDYEWSESFDKYKRFRKVNWLLKGIREDIRSINRGKTMTLGTVYQFSSISAPDILAVLKKHSRILPDDGVNLKSQPYVFIIDEINRGNISKIFGELITLIEPNKRLGSDEEAKATLPYSGEEFGVPNNVYILGTMNTADRSIALLDTALRRRFDFVEMPPRPDLLEGIAIEGTDINLVTMLQKMNDRIEFLLDREHTIGHAYFMGDFEEHPTLDGLADIFRNKIVPLLQEYFFDDYSKIRLVLGDNAKSKDCQFVLEETSHALLFPGAPAEIDLDKPTYKINSDAFGKQEAYIGIYA